MFDSYNLWLVSVVAATVTILAAAFIFVFYTYLMSRLPDAVWLKALKQRVLEQEARLDELKSNLQEHKAELQQAQKETREANDARNRAVEEKNQAEAWIQEHAEDIAQIPKWKEAIAELKEKGEEARAKLAEVQQQRANLALELADLERKAELLKREVVDLENRKKELHKEIKQSEQRSSELQSQTAIAEGKLAETKAKLEDLRLERDGLKAKIESAKKELADIKKEKWSAENDLKETQARREGIEKEIHEKQRTSANLSQMLAELGGRIDDFANAIKPPALLERLEDLHRPVLKLPEEYYLHTRNEQHVLQHFAEQVEQSGFIFHERAIHAFHTSLKIADISPLVVLAGISGTGKSQLPRLYAKYVGMHFLNVAVQPRWDAPEDLFGFYNYMEHRYKATELARGLRQMDIHFHPAEDGDEYSESLQEGMLLVLLDEMNLARVEYYFSELLSKLEMRSRSRLKDDEMYSLSSIQVQAGSLSEEDGDDNKPLFVGYNVLFVGTMNEDETTQSLSDKVIDRSNVLRFGRPTKTRSEVIAESENSEPYYLEHKMWESWIKHDLDDAADSDRLNGYCQKLNEALEKVGRPFGHRIHQAISQYVANYPNWVDNCFEKAFADQLEQKILPKLRGLSRDTDDQLDAVFSTIKGIIGDLNDTELADAFSTACEKPVFDFKGVNRRT